MRRRIIVLSMAILTANMVGCAGTESRTRTNLDTIILQAPCDQKRTDSAKFITLTKTGEEFSLHMIPLNDEEIKAINVVNKLGGDMQTYGNFMIYCNPNNNAIILSPVKK